MDQDIDQAIRTFNSLRGLATQVFAAADAIADSFSIGGKLLTCGNGGSADLASHLAAELVGRFRADRQPYAAFSLGSDQCVVTAIANDYSFSDVFSRQIEGSGRPGDTLVVFSTSGDSLNILHSLETAKAKGLCAVAFLGPSSGAARKLADIAVCVESDSTARIQEAHTFLLHALCTRVEHLLGHD